MKRWQLTMFISIFAAVVVIASWYGWAKRTQSRREAGYQLALQSFTAALTLGMTREKVEGYLHTRGVQFNRTPWVNPKANNTDITKIGQEPPPWYCSRENIYIAFQFIPESVGSDSANPSDSLTKITIFPMFEDCL